MTSRGGTQVGWAGWSLSNILSYVGVRGRLGKTWGWDSARVRCHVVYVKGWKISMMGWAPLGTVSKGCW